MSWGGRDALSHNRGCNMRSELFFMLSYKPGTVVFFYALEETAVLNLQRSAKDTTSCSLSHLSQESPKALLFLSVSAIAKQVTIICNEPGDFVL